MSAPVLVVGATGFLGQEVVRALLARGKSVRALARDGTDPGPLRDLGVEIVRGNMLDPPSLERALDGATALITTAIGYSAMIRYFGRGTYIADTAVQAEPFGPVPAFEDSLRRALKDGGMMGA